MERLRAPVAVTIATLVLAATAAVLSAPDLTVSVLTDSDRWPTGSVIPFTVRIANTGREAVELAFSNGCRASVIVQDAAGSCSSAWDASAP